MDSTSSKRWIRPVSPSILIFMSLTNERTNVDDRPRNCVNSLDCACLFFIINVQFSSPPSILRQIFIILFSCCVCTIRFNRASNSFLICFFFMYNNNTTTNVSSFFYIVQRLNKNKEIRSIFFILYFFYEKKNCQL